MLELILFQVKCQVLWLSVAFRVGPRACNCAECAKDLYQTLAKSIDISVSLSGQPYKVAILLIRSQPERATNTYIHEVQEAVLYVPYSL
jgi:hypothetical protein